MKILKVLPKKELIISSFFLFLKKLIMRLDTKFFIFVTFSFVILYYNQSFFSEYNFSDKLILFIIPLIWPGLAHGSLDLLIAKN